VSAAPLRLLFASAEAKAAGRPALIGTIEGCQFLDGRLERVKHVYDRGVRHLQLVHYMPSDLGDQQTEDPKWGGLSPLGADVVRECNRLGIVVDVAHGTQALVQQAAAVSPAPFVLSHTSLARGAPAQYSRLISTEHARLVAQAGSSLIRATVVSNSDTAVLNCPSSQPVVGLPKANGLAPASNSSSVQLCKVPALPNSVTTMLLM